MTLHDSEHAALMAQFEKNYAGMRMDREDRKSGLWEKGYLYQDGEVNKLFLAYRQGYALAKSIFEDA